MTEDKLVSIIVPIYNVERYLERCIQSIVHQTYQNIEILLINDGSTDQSEDICRNWIEKDSRIVLYNKSNGGLSDARNYGLEKMNGEYIVFVDSDDWICRDMISLMYANMEETKADVVCCGLIETSDSWLHSKEWFHETLVLDAEKAMDYLVENKTLTSHAVVKMYKKHVFNSIAFPKGKLFEDIWIMHRIFEKCNKISIIPQCLYYYYIREDSISNIVKLKNRLAWVEALQKRYNDIHHLKKLYKDQLLSQIAIVYSLTIIQNIFDKKEIHENKTKIIKMQNFLKQKEVECAVKIYATQNQYLYYRLARIFSYHFAGFYKIIKSRIKSVCL